jgi:hypothetical protein
VTKTKRCFISHQSNFEAQLESCRKALAGAGDGDGDAVLATYFENYWLKHPRRWVLPFSCVKILAAKKPRVFLDLDGNGSGVSEKATFAKTRRLIQLQETVEAIIGKYFLQVS